MTAAADRPDAAGQLDADEVARTVLHELCTTPAVYHEGIIRRALIAAASPRTELIAKAVAEALAPVLALHVADGSQNPWCDHDGYSWPCPTIRAAAAPEEGR